MPATGRNDFFVPTDLHVRLGHIVTRVRPGRETRDPLELSGDIFDLLLPGESFGLVGLPRVALESHEQAKDLLLAHLHTAPMFSKGAPCIRAAPIRSARPERIPVDCGPSSPLPPLMTTRLAPSSL